MKFTEGFYPKYAIRLNSGALAYLRVSDTQEKAVVFFSKRELARNWLRQELPNRIERSQIIDLDFEYWWQKLLEMPRYKYMAIGMNTGPTGMVIMKVAEAINACVEFSKDGAALTVADFEQLMDEPAMDLVGAKLVADTNPVLKKVLAKVRDFVESSDTFIPTVFCVDLDWAITTIEYPVFDEANKDKAADMMVTLVREGNVAVALAAAIPDDSQGGFRCEPVVCKPQAIHVSYEELGLNISCMAKVQRDGGRRALSDWSFGIGDAHKQGRFQGVFSKARAMGPAPRSRDDVAQEMRRDLAILARTKGITRQITFIQLTGHCSESEINRLVFKWNWQMSGLNDAGSDDPISANQVMDELWETTIDPKLT